MSQNEMKSILERLQARKEKLWKLLVDVNLSEKMANAITEELRKVETRMFSIQCKLMRA
jgi:predicted transcriptional regulator